MESIKFGIVNRKPTLNEWIDVWNKKTKVTVNVKKIEEFEIERTQIYKIRDDEGINYWVQVKTGQKMKMFLFEADNITVGENLRVATLITGKKINIGKVIEINPQPENVVCVKTLLNQKENCFFVTL